MEKYKDFKVGDYVLTFDNNGDTIDELSGKIIVYENDILIRSTKTHELYKVSKFTYEIYKVIEMILPYYLKVQEEFAKEFNTHGFDALRNNISILKMEYEEGDIHLTLDNNCVLVFESNYITQQDITTAPTVTLRSSFGDVMGRIERYF